MKMIEVKKIYLLFSLVVIFLLCFSANGNQPEWYAKLKQIKPLKSSKQDVERVFNFPQIRNSFKENRIEVVYYEIADGKFTVEYIAEDCSSVSRNSYSPRKGTVLSIMFIAHKELKLSKFNVDRKQLVKRIEAHDSTEHYSNPELGVEYIGRKGKVEIVKFYATSENEHLQCKK